jgi:D-alanine--poly(phosphoribitol) ligase subunit 2
MNTTLYTLVVDSVTELNDGLAAPVPIELGFAAPLFGADGVLDSLALVTLVLALEDSIEERTGIAVSLADERAVSQTASPFRTVGTLTAYVETLMREADWAEP